VLAYCFCLSATAGYAEPPRAPNLFFGFDHVLYPIGVKRACGGETQKDMARIETLIAAFPKAAKQAELSTDVQILRAPSDRATGLRTIFGANIPEPEIEPLCTLARRLNLDWLTPNVLILAKGDSMSEAQKLDWTAFSQFVGTLDFQE
jgi:hypothetical protein